MELVPLMNESQTMHLTDPPLKRLWRSIAPPPQHYLATEQVGKQRVGLPQKQFFLFFFATPKFANCTRLTRGDAAQSDTVQRQDKCGFEVTLTLIRLTNPALKSTCVPPGFVWCHVTALNDTNVHVRKISFCPLIRFQMPPVACVVVAVLLTSVAGVQCASVS